MSCSVAEKSLTALLMLSQATKTQSSGPGFGDAPPKGHHHLRNPTPQHGSKTMHREWTFQNGNELLGG
jgi:hypothetical protein